MGARDPAIWDRGVGLHGYPGQKGGAGGTGNIGAGDGAVKTERGIVVCEGRSCVEGSGECQGVARDGWGATGEIGWNCEDSYSC